MAADFARTRSPQADADFLAECELPDDAEANRSAIAVRRSVAKYGMIDPTFIRATDRYPEELMALSGWDSIDFLGWVIELDDDLGEPVRSEWFDGLPESFSVRDLAHCVYRGRAAA
jgi:hypothetical protein